MGKIKIINISPHSPSNEIIEVSEAKAKMLVKSNQARYADKPMLETKQEKAKLKKIETML